jgi:hypothetical protein
MAGVEVKNVSSPDETRDFSGMGTGAAITIAGRPVLYSTFQPGWRWSEHVKPIVGTDKCEATHAMYVLSGRMGIAHDDGTEVEVGPGDVVVIEPEHDAWIVGDETFTAIDFGGYARYGLPRS